MTRYYKLFDLLNRKGMKKSDLREILSPKTIAKLSKGEHISGEVIEKICLFLNCQPGEIMEIIETEKIDDKEFLTTKTVFNEEYENSLTETYLENTSGIPLNEADELNLTNRQIIDRDDWNCSHSNKK